jgi:hypothetical protein
MDGFVSLNNMEDWMNTEEEKARLELAQLLARRLERLSADSLWARRASGARGALLKLLEEANPGCLPPDPQARLAYHSRLQLTMDWGFALLARAAREYT